MAKKYRLTSRELTNIPQDDISTEDKELIEGAVREYAGLYEESANTERRQALRSYLVNLLTEMGPDAAMRQEIGKIAAQFADGWEYAHSA